MRKIYLSLAALAIAGMANAQLVKHFTADDAAYVTGWWVADSGTSAWDLGSCANDENKKYAVYSVNLDAVEEKFGAGGWGTDFKIDTAMNKDFETLFSANQSKLYLNLYMSALDGVNAGDSVQLVFEALAGEKFGWPGAKTAAITSDWSWVSVDVSTLDFSGKALADIEGVTIFKISVQAAKDYEKQEGYFKVAIQDITFSKTNAAAKPALNPCEASGSSKLDVAKGSLNFYPNPATDKINFNEPSTGYIANMLGAVVATFNGATEVSVSHLPKGVYVVNSNNASKKLMIQE
jgi:hypothetical protein